MIGVHRLYQMGENSFISHLETQLRFKNAEGTGAPTNNRGVTVCLVCLAQRTKRIRAAI